MSPPTRLVSFSRVSVVAALALLGVLVALAGYSIGMDRRSSAATEQADHATQLASAYSDFNAQLLELEGVATDFILVPTPERRADFDVRVAAMLAQLDYIGSLSSAEGRAHLAFVRDQYLPQLAVVQDFFDALLTGKPFHEVMPDAAVVGELQARMAAPMEEQRAAARETMSELRAWQRQRVWTTAGVFAGGLGAAALLLLVLRSAFGTAARAEIEARQFQAEALRDSLTGLGNHRAFQEALHGPAARRGSLALLDIDRFKEVNDTRGHAAGDRVLRAFSTMIQSRFPQAAYRIGGDEFAILSTECELSAQVDQLLHDIRAGWLGVSTSAGLTSWSDGGVDPDLHLAEADAALRWAKREGRERIVEYASVAASVGGVRSARKSEALRRLLTSRRGLAPVFQPIWSLDGELRAFEALSRFDPAVGFAGPQEAFDIAHQDGRSFELDALACERILAAARDLPGEALLFINISPASLVDPRFSVARIAQLVADAGRASERVVIEVTERSTVPLGILGERIGELRAAGFAVALDDVGAGNSGLETLRAVPVDWVKVDRSIVAGATASLSSRGLLKAIFSFADEVGATIVAEGIEAETELALVDTLARGELRTAAEPRVRVVAQGYLLGMPAPAAAGAPGALGVPVPLLSRAA